MSQIAKQIGNLLLRLQEKLPDQQVGLVPADAFFTRKIDLPEGLSRSERMDFIQLNLEGNSPFPMDQLAWGFLEHPKASFAFAYATPRARLKRLDITHLEKFHQLFPGFISLHDDPLEKPTIRFISQNGVISALYLSGTHPVPEKILSRRITGELLTDDIQLEARDFLVKGHNTEGYECETGLWLGEGVDIDNNGRVHFKHRHISSEGSKGLKVHTLTLEEAALWNSDLRDADYANRESQSRQRSSLIWKSLRIAGWSALFLIIFQLFTFGLIGFNTLKERKIAVLEPDAVRVENKLTLATRLTQSTEEDLKPFLLMESFNSVRPDSIFFEKVRSKAFNEIEIEGKSSKGVTPVNAFADAIGQLPFVDSVENNSRTQNNQTSFEFLITFSELPPEPEGGFVIPDEPEESEESTTEDKS